MPLVNVLTPKYFTAPYSFKTSMTTKKRPEKIETLERGITILKNVFDFDIPKLFDNSM